MKTLNFGLVALVLMQATPSFAGIRGVTLEECQKNISGLVRAITPSPLEDPADLYNAQMQVESECFEAAARSGEVTRAQVDSVASAVSDLRDAACALPRADGTMNTTGQQNACELDILSAALRNL